MTNCKYLQPRGEILTRQILPNIHLYIQSHLEARKFYFKKFKNPYRTCKSSTGYYKLKPIIEDFRNVGFFRFWCMARFFSCIFSPVELMSRGDLPIHLSPAELMTGGKSLPYLPDCCLSSSLCDIHMIFISQRWSPMGLPSKLWTDYIHWFHELDYL